MRKLGVFIGVGIIFACGIAQAAERAGATHISAMSGCFSVTYRFIEDGKRDIFSEDYGLNEPVTEAIEISSKGQNSLTLTNYAIVGDGRRLPHWHRVWVYLRNRDIWRLTVWGSSQDSSNREFRYTCHGKWQQNRFDCDGGVAPKPFRDDGAPFGFLRDDYDSIDRYDTFLVTPEGFAQTSQNRKLDSNGDVVSYETGWILYDQQPPEKCNLNGAARENATDGSQTSSE